jgi:hypothetical protein
MQYFLKLGEFWKSETGYLLNSIHMRMINDNRIWCRPFQELLSGFQSGWVSKLTRFSSIMSQCFLFLLNIITSGSKWDESSNVPRLRVICSSDPLLRPNIGLPQFLQNPLVTWFPLFASRTYSPGSPNISTSAILNIAPVVCPVPLIRWQSWQ